MAGSIGQNDGDGLTQVGFWGQYVRGLGSDARWIKTAHAALPVELQTLPDAERILLADVIRRWVVDYGHHVACATGEPHADAAWHIRSHLWWWTITRTLEAARCAAGLGHITSQRQRLSALDQLTETGVDELMMADDPGLWRLWSGFAWFELTTVVYDSIARACTGTRPWAGEKILRLYREGHHDELVALTEREVLGKALGKPTDFDPLKVAGEAGSGDERDPIRVYILGGLLGPGARGKGRVHEAASKLTRELDERVACPVEVRISPSRRFAESLNRLLPLAQEHAYISVEESRALSQGKCAALDSLRARRDEQMDLLGRVRTQDRELESAARALFWLYDSLADPDPSPDSDEGLILGGFAIGRLTETVLDTAEGCTVSGRYLKDADRSFAGSFRSELGLLAGESKARLRGISVRALLAGASAEGSPEMLLGLAAVHELLADDRREPALVYLSDRNVRMKALQNGDRKRGVTPAADMMAGTIVAGIQLQRLINSRKVNALLEDPALTCWVSTRMTQWTAQRLAYPWSGGVRVAVATIGPGLPGWLAACADSAPRDRHRGLLDLIPGAESLQASSLDLYRLENGLTALDVVARQTGTVARGCAPGSEFASLIPLCIGVIRREVGVSVEAGFGAFHDSVKRMLVLRADPRELQVSGYEAWTRVQADRRNPLRDLVDAAYDAEHPEWAFLLEMSRLRAVGRTPDTVVRLIATNGVQ